VPDLRLKGDHLPVNSPLLVHQLDQLSLPSLWGCQLMGSGDHQNGRLWLSTSGGYGCGL